MTYIAFYVDKHGVDHWLPSGSLVDAKADLNRAEKDGHMNHSMRRGIATQTHGLVEAKPVPQYELVEV